MKTYDVIGTVKHNVIIRVKAKGIDDAIAKVKEEWDCPVTFEQFDTYDVKEVE